MTEAATAETLPPKAQEIIQAVETMTILELAALVKAMETKFGVSAAALATGGGSAAAGAGPGGAPAVEEKTTFEVILAEVGSNKIQVIKEIRAVTNLGLKEAKELVDSAPKTIKTGVAKDEANTIKQKLEAVGARVDLT